MDLCWCACGVKYNYTLMINVKFYFTIWILYQQYYEFEIAMSSMDES